MIHRYIYSRCPFLIIECYTYYMYYRIFPLLRYERRDFDLKKGLTSFKLTNGLHILSIKQ